MSTCESDSTVLQDKPGPAAMIAEDDEITVALLESVLTRGGFSVQIARDGRQALSLVETLPNPPTVVLLDIMLPYVDGFELLRKIRAQAGWHEVPVIMLTSKSQEQTIIRALDAGANDYIVKPFRPGEMMARIRRITHP